MKAIFKKAEVKNLIIGFCLCCIGFLVALFFSVRAYAAGNKTIRVAFPIQAGITECDENGNYSGYTYEYLQKIAQYTGWNYEFVQIPGDLNKTLSTMLAMVEHGELDLMGGIVKNEQTALQYNFSQNSYGTAYSTLCVLQENCTINETDYRTFAEIRVAVRKTATARISGLQSFCSANNFSVTLVECDSDEEQLEALRTGRADALLTVDLNKLEGVRPVAKFLGRPYYFITTKGNDDIMGALNAALLKIEEADPYYSFRLYKKYFETAQAPLHFSEKEQAYLRTAPTLRVLALLNDEPFQYVNQAGEFCGIAREVLRKISQNTGLNFEFVFCTEPETVLEQIAEEDIDLLCAVPYDYSLANAQHIFLTQPYMQTHISFYFNQRVDVENLQNGRIALPAGTKPMEASMQGHISYYKTLEECIKAVNNGWADYGYASDYSVTHWTSRKPYPHVVTITAVERKQEYCMGVSAMANENLLAILNKTISAISSSELQALTLRSISQSNGKITLSQFVLANPAQVGMWVFILAVVLLTILFFIVSSRIRINQKLALGKKRYLQLAELANELIFEYNFQTDRLAFSEKSAERLGMPQSIKHFKKYLQENTAFLSVGKHIVAFCNQTGDAQEAPEEMLCPLADGTQRWVQLVGSVLYSRKQTPICVIGKFVDIQREKETMKYLVQQAEQDSMTGIYNAATCQKLISAYLAQTTGKTHGAFFILDIDYFKTVNDTMGHYVGDEVLKNTANRLKDIFAQTDIVGRLGGDEFIMLAKDCTGAEDALKKCQELRAKMKTTLEEKGRMFQISVSIGATLVSENCTFEQLYRKADEALYLAKERGRDGYELLNSNPTKT